MRIRSTILTIAILLLPGLAEAGPHRPERKPANQPKSEWSPPKLERKPAEKPAENWAPPRREPVVATNAPRVGQPRVGPPQRPQVEPRPVVTPQPAIDDSPASYPVFIPIYETQPILERQYVFISSVTGICELSVEDEFLAWQLADITGLPYWEIAVARGEGWTWPSTLRDLEIDESDLWLALQFAAEDRPLPLDWNDDDVTELTQILIGDHVLPELDCGDGFWVNPPDPYARYAYDDRDQEIAERIATQAGFKVEQLLLAHREFHHWSEVARVFSMSPFLFEIVFDLQLPGVWRSEFLHVDYPADNMLRDSVGEELPRRMSWSPEPATEGGALRTGLKWATFFGIVSLVGGLAG